jgi:hypothetical protein
MLVSENTNMKLLYILGYGRSGSTAMDIVLGTHCAAEGLGEVRNFFLVGLSDKNISQFWLDFGEYREEKNRTEFIEDRETVKIESFSRYWFANETSIQKYCDLQRNFFSDFKNYSDKSVFIDSSKSTSGNAWRFSLLRKSGIDIYPVLLWRNLTDVYLTTRKGTNRDLEKHGRGKPVNVFRLSMSWFLANGVALFQMRKEKKGIIISYEKFIESPNKMAKEIYSRVGLDGWLDLQEFQVGNQAFGNRLKSQEVLILKASSRENVKIDNLFSRLVVLFFEAVWWGMRSIFGRRMVFPLK